MSTTPLATYYIYTKSTKHVVGDKTISTGWVDVVDFMVRRVFLHTSLDYKMLIDGTAGTTFAFVRRVILRQDRGRGRLHGTRNMAGVFLPRRMLIIRGV